MHALETLDGKLMQSFKTKSESASRARLELQSLLWECIVATFSLEERKNERKKQKVDVCAIWGAFENDVVRKLFIKDFVIDSPT